jgi:hypothetical protein
VLLPTSGELLIVNRVVNVCCALDDHLVFKLRTLVISGKGGIHEGEMIIERRT